MTASELLAKQIDESAYQLDKVLEGITEADADHKLTKSSMSIREQLSHLCEVYVAVEEMSRGVEHEWGSYSVADASLCNLKKQLSDLRTKAIAVSKSDDEKTLTAASGFIVGHDNYHVGQMVMVRLDINPDWDAYSIYRF